MAEDQATDLRRRISAYPDAALTFFQSAFSALNRLSEDAREKLIDSMAAGLRKGRRRIAGATVRDVAELHEGEANQVASAISLVLGLLSETKTSPSQFQAEADGKLFLAADAAGAMSVVNTICRRMPEFDAYIGRAQLAATVLPSLTDFEIAVDLRLRIKDKSISYGVPVAVIHIGSDSESEIWLQMSQADVEDTIEKLQNCLDQLSIASTLIKAPE